MHASKPLRVEFGYASDRFLPEGVASSVRHDSAWIVILAYPGATVQAILPLLEAIAGSRRPAVFFCSAIDPELRDTLIVNNLHGTLRCVVVDAPCMSDYDRAQLFQVAAATGARVIASDAVLARTSLDALGEAGSVTVDAMSTVLAGFA